MVISSWFPTTFLMDMVHSIDRQLLVEYAYRLREQSCGRDVTNIGAWQSNDLDLSNIELQELLFVADKYANQMHTELNFKTNLRQVIDNVWVNINPRGGTNRLHIHGENCISGVFYVKCNKSSGNIVFPHPAANFIYNTPESLLEKYTEKNSQFSEHSPQEGKIILFPSWAYHYVEPNMSDEDRIAFAFNTKVTQVLTV
jgi:uncharacterized protein (TIGR02466 family)